MVAITASNRATPSLSVSLAKSRVEQARREAAQAETNAQHLRAQADNQERIAEQGHQRANSLTKSAQFKSSSDASPTKATSDTAAVSATQTSATYGKTLAGVFQAVKPLMNAGDLSATEKNVVTSSLLQATADLGLPSQTKVRAVQLYDSQTPNSSALKGNVLNASA